MIAKPDGLTLRTTLDRLGARVETRRNCLGLSVFSLTRGGKTTDKIDMPMSDESLRAVHDSIVRKLLGREVKT